MLTRRWPTLGVKIVDFTMEAAGIEPASENVPQESLHTCQVAICLVPRPKATCKLAGAQAVEFRLSPPGQQFEAILQKVTPFN